MTTIAWDGKTLAADSYMMYGDMIHDDDVKKIFVFTNAIFAAAGCWPDILRVVNWIQEGQAEDKKPKDCDFVGLLVTEDAVYEVTEGLVFIQWPRSKKIARGSGEAFAQAALDLGHSAKEAVRVATKRDPYSGGKVRTKKG